MQSPFAISTTSLSLSRGLNLSRIGVFRSLAFRLQNGRSLQDGAFMFTLSLLLRGVRMFQCFVGLVRTKI